MQANPVNYIPPCNTEMLGPKYLDAPYILLENTLFHDSLSEPFVSLLTHFVLLATFT